MFRGKESTPRGKDTPRSAAPTDAEDDVATAGAGAPARRKQASTMGFGRRQGQAPVPVDIPELLNGVKVDVHVRCRPMFADEIKAGDKVVLKVLEEEAGVKIKAMGAHAGSDRYWYDNAFGPDASQEHVYNVTAKPIVDNVMKGMNCCMFAYGQTGTGKTHTMMGDIHDADSMGLIPRAVADMFEQLAARGTAFVVKASFLEVYNEQLTDLLIRPEAARPLKLVEDPKRGAVCQNLTEVHVTDLDEVLALIATGNRRCQMAATNINNRSNRAHRIFIITCQFSKAGDPGSDMADTIIAKATHSRKAKLTEFGCLTLVDLAGSECVGRSGATDGRLIEAGNINKSLLTLGRVINALANNEPRIPYRDSKLTRLTAEALGGKCKTVIIATVAPGAFSAMESSSTLKYAERARSALNATQLSKSQVLEAKLARLSELYLELQEEMKQNLTAFEQERRLVQRTHDHQLTILKDTHRRDMMALMESRDKALGSQIASLEALRAGEDEFLKTARRSSSALEASLLKDLQALTTQVDSISHSMDSWNEKNAARMCTSGDGVATLVQDLSGKLSTLSKSIKSLVTSNTSVLSKQKETMEAFAAAEMEAMRETSEDMIQRLAKVMSRHAKAHASRVQAAMSGVLSSNSQLTADTNKIYAMTSEMTSEVADSIVKWSQSTTDELVGMGKEAEKDSDATAANIQSVKASVKTIKKNTTGQLRELYSATVHHHSVTDAEACRVLAIATSEKEVVPQVLQGPTPEEEAAQKAAEEAHEKAVADEAARRAARRSTASGATVKQVHAGICPTSRLRSPPSTTSRRRRSGLTSPTAATPGSTAGTPTATPTSPPLGPRRVARNTLHREHVPTSVDTAIAEEMASPATTAADGRLSAVSAISSKMGGDGRQSTETATTVETRVSFADTNPVKEEEEAPAPAPAAEEEVKEAVEEVAAPVPEANPEAPKVTAPVAEPAKDDDDESGLDKLSNLAEMLNAQRNERRPASKLAQK